MIEHQTGARVDKRLTGRIKVHPDGYGFVVPDDASEDIHISAGARGNSLDADRVEVEWWVGHRGLEGRVIRVTERGRAKITGVIVEGRGGIHLQPDDPRIGTLVLLPRGAGAGFVGRVAVAEITRYPERPGDAIEGVVLRSLGEPGDPRTEIEKILACADVDETFPDEVAGAAAALPDELCAADREDREDLRHVPFTTIDPETARDFDDAVAIEDRPGGGHRLWIAVADVSHYVREGTALDAEAQRRGCSVYLPHRAIPMLPEQLSGNLCSLLPETDRLAMVTRIDFDQNLAIIEVAFSAAIIHSRARLDYPGVAAALGGEPTGKRKKYEPFLPALRTMDSFARELRKKRQLRGALDLDLPEPVIELDRDDPMLVRNVRRSRRDPGERGAYAMIEEFMLAANDAVGASFQSRGEPTLWRIHDVPDTTRLETFATMAEAYGFRFDAEEGRSPRGLAAVLVRLKGQPAEKPLSFQLLRSLKQATYDVNNVGHFGLAATAYLHFTSPIRRYPDVVVHRLLKRRLATLGKPAGGFPPMAASPRSPDAEALQRTARQSSFSERKAMEVEREVVDLYRALFMRDRIGDVLTGTIAGVTSFGVFVSIDDPFVEGLIRIENLSPASAAAGNRPANRPRFEFDETRSRLYAPGSGRSFALGDRVSVEILSISVARRQIDMKLVDVLEQAPGLPDRPRPRDGQRPRQADVRSHTGFLKPGHPGRSGAKDRPASGRPPVGPGPGRPGTDRRGKGTERPAAHQGGRPRPSAERPGKPALRSGRKGRRR